jgi:signal transduction histidine kinase
MMAFYKRNSAVGLVIFILLSFIPGWAYGQGDNAGISNINIDTSLLNKQLEEAIALEQKDFPAALKVYERVLDRSLRAGYTTGVLRACNGMGSVRMREGKYALAIASFKKGLSFCDTVVHGNYYAVLHNNIGNACNYLLDYNLASKHYYTAAQYARRYPGKFPPGYAYSNLATVLAQLKQYRKAIAYTDMALPYAVSARDYHLQANLLANKGSLYHGLEQYDEALLSLEAAAALSRQHDLYKIWHIALTNMAAVYLSRKEPESALEKLRAAQALEPGHGIGLNESTAVLSSIGDTYLQMKNYAGARKYLYLADERIENVSHKKLFLLLKLSELEAATGNYRKAYAMQEEYHWLKDSLQSQEVTLKVSDMEARYRTAEKDKDIARKQLHIAGQEKQLERKNLWMVILSVTALLLVGVFMVILLFIKQRNKLALRRKEVESLKARIEGEEQERQRLAGDLHDGIGSQLAAATTYLVAMSNIFPELHTTHHYHKTKEVLYNTAAELRRVSHNLLPDVIGRKGLTAALDDFCRDNSNNGIAIEFHAYGKFEHSSPFLSLTIYRIVQELIHNILKHASASEAIVLLNEHASEISIIVEDNGVGIDTGRKEEGIGLVNIRRRIMACAGTMQIEQGAVKGTIVSVFLPKERNDQNTITAQQLW